MRKNNTAIISILGGVIIALILVLGTIWMGQSARKDTNNAVRTVSDLYRDSVVYYPLKEVELFITCIS